jgi:hypothetical protein
MPRTKQLSESMLTKTVGTRIRNANIEEIHRYAELDDVTPSKWIAKLVYQELARRKAARV